MLKYKHSAESLKPYSIGRPVCIAPAPQSSCPPNMYQVLVPVTNLHCTSNTDSMLFSSLSRSEKFQSHLAAGNKSYPIPASLASSASSPSIIFFVKKVFTQQCDSCSLWWPGPYRWRCSRFFGQNGNGFSQILLNKLVDLFNRLAPWSKYNVEILNLFLQRNAAKLVDELEIGISSQKFGFAYKSLYQRDITFAFGYKSFRCGRLSNWHALQYGKANASSW